MTNNLQCIIKSIELCVYAIIMHMQYTVGLADHVFKNKLKTTQIVFFVANNSHKRWNLLKFSLFSRNVLNKRRKILEDILNASASSVEVLGSLPVRRRLWLTVLCRWQRLRQATIRRTATEFHQRTDIRQPEVLQHMAHCLRGLSVCLGSVFLRSECRLLSRPRASSSRPWCSGAWVEGRQLAVAAVAVERPCGTRSETARGE